LDHRIEAGNECEPTCSVLDGAQAGKQGARSGDLRKCIAKKCPREPLHAQSRKRYSTVKKLRQRRDAVQLAACMKMLALFSVRELTLGMALVLCCTQHPALPALPFCSVLEADPQCT
jgi:hypothetical protein